MNQEIIILYSKMISAVPGWQNIHNTANVLKVISNDLNTETKLEL